MPIVSANGNGSPMPFAGIVTKPIEDAGYYTNPFGPGTVVKVYPSNQVAGLVPVFPCTEADCREGKYGADSIANDHNYELPVFAELSPTSPINYYYNDQNSWLFDFPDSGKSGCTMEFYLDQYNSFAEIWMQRGHLNVNTYGTYYAPGSLCTNLNWKGFLLEWYKVLAAWGEGKFRFRVQVVHFGSADYTTCFKSPTFCLKQFDCYAADQTTKWEALYQGGVLGNIDKKWCGGGYWEFCCVKTIPVGGSTASISTPIEWTDSIRFGGFFGYENTDYERKSIKYATGVVHKVRDEAINKFTLRTTSLPFWLHERFKTYGLFADLLQVSDYNINNSDYNLNRYCVQSDSSYAPDYHGRSRYSKVKCDFKAGTQYIIRTRCCSSPRS